jgi:hydroxyacylglutathione hydrolase
MLDSLNRLKKLRPDTLVYCTHEYTAKNIDFALTLEPDNLDLHKRKIEVARLRRNNKASLPTSIGLELKTNPFLRCNQHTIIKNAKVEKDDELSVFSKIRTLRNHY